MKRRKNLERAVILGLLLSTSVYGSAWAAEGPITENSEINSPYTGDVTFQGDDKSAIEVIDREVEISTTDGGTITLDSDKYGIRLDGTGSVILKPTGDNVIKVTVNSTNKEIGDGINVTENAGGTITLNGANNTITVEGEHSDGVYTAAGSNTNINLIATTGSNTINATNNGIDHRGNNTITLEANGGSNIIQATNGDGIRVEGTGTVEFNAQNNTITAGDNGIQVTGGGIVNLTANGGNNTITAVNNGIEVANGTLNITANEKNDITAGVTGINVVGNSNAYVDGKEITITVEKNVQATSPTTDMAAGINLGKKEGSIAKFGNLILGSNNDIKNNKFVIDVTNNNDSKYSSAVGINVTQNSTLRTENTIGDVSIKATNTNGGTATGISVAGSTVDVSANSFNITAVDGVTSQSNAKATGISAASNANVKIDAGNGIIINAENKQNISNFNKNTTAIDANMSTVYIDAGSDIVLNYIQDKNDVQQLASEINKLEDGIFVGQQGSVVLTSQNNEINAMNGITATGANPVQVGGSAEEFKGSVMLDAQNANNITATQFGIKTNGASQGENAARVELNAMQNNIYVYADTGSSTFSKGIEASYDGVVKIGNHDERADITNIIVKNVNENTFALRAVDATYSANVDIDSDIINLVVDDSEVKLADSQFSYGVYGQYYSNVDFDANTINMDVSNGKGVYAWADVTVDFSANDIYLNSNDDTVYAEFGSRVILNSDNTFVNTANGDGIYTASEWNNKENIVALTANNTNIVRAGNFDVITIDGEETILGYGDLKAINALSAGQVSLNAGDINSISGAVYAKGIDTKVGVTGLDNGCSNNYVYSAAIIDKAGDIDTTIETDNKFYNKKFVSALYAEEGANINLTGENYIGTWADNTDKNTLERTVWAYDEATINITGASHIGTDRYSLSPNSADVAVAAGTATGLTYKMVDEFNGTRAEVNVKYDDFSNENASSISGDILSAYAGLVNIDSDNKNAGISIEGNLLAGNNGILNVDIGKGGILTGRADDYGDAGVVNNFEADEANEHQEFYNPAFSSTIYKGGRVDLGMGAGSKWYVAGQSWITTIDTSEAKGDMPEERATIDLVTEYKDKDGGDIAAHALTIYDFKGDADFLMNLSGNRADTDMLYMKHADGNYRIMLDEDITSTDINQDKEGNEYSGLRFATVGADSNVTFSVGSYDNGGAFNVEYEVGQDEYGGAETAHENEAYNGTELNGGKPGDNMVDNFFGSEGEPVTDESSNEGGISTASANGIMLMNEEVETFADEENNANKYNAINHKIIAIKDTELNDTGETILNMSRANYSNAIYMDRLNKRLGEARYINDDPEEDEGMWVRIRHDRIGKDDAYRSQNTMYELGYDKKQDCDNGERRVGFAVDYMHGDTGYTDIAGKGEIDRYGLWLYDTWMGDKGHYVDYVAKWGHLDNDFEVYTMRNGDKVTGDYSNNVFSVSAEYGRKKDIGNDWYFEPQAQLQLARVTGADYTTNQGTKVSVDGINSLIGRAGFRIGKDFGEEKQSTLYFKADVLHEFLGDQDVYVMDKSTDNKWAGISYDNEGTWYDIGIGYAAMLSQSTYAFIDLEQSFGNDNDDTYQINAGVRWTF